MHVLDTDTLTRAHGGHPGIAQRVREVLELVQLTGKEAEKILGQAGITVNKNTIPDDPQSPFVTSGIRVGTPALCARGMGPKEMQTVGDLMTLALSKPE